MSGFKFSMSDSPFSQILEQATTEFLQFMRPLQKGAIGVYPKSFEGRVLRLIKFKTLSEAFSEVTAIEDFKIGDGGVDVVAFVPNHPDFLQIVLNYFQNMQNYRLHILIMPRYGSRCQKAVQMSGLSDKLNIVEFHADMILIEPYQFIVPAPNCFKRIYIDGDIDDLYLISRSLVKIEILHGMFPEIVTYGENSERVAHLLHEMKAQIGMGAFAAHPTYSQCIIIDRIYDNMTPLLTQLTYSGVIDENMKLDCGILSLPDSVQYEQRQIILNDNDPVYKDIKGFGLQKATEFISQASTDMMSLSASLVPGMEMAKFQVQARKAKSLSDRKPFFALHLNIMDYLAVAKSKSENFNDTISFELASILGSDPDLDLANKLMRQDENWPEAMRLFCIASQSRAGLPAAIISQFRRQAIAKFGLEFVKTLEQFEHIGLLTQNRSSIFGPKQFTFQMTAQAFDLLPKNTDEETVKNFNEKDIGSFYDGYVPLTARLVQTAVTGDFKNSQKTKAFDALGIKYTKHVVTPDPFAEEPDQKKVLVFIIGGMTYSETAAIKALGTRIFNGKVDFDLGTTEMLSGNRLLRQMCPTI